MRNSLKELIKTDIYRHYGSSPLPVLWWVRNPSLSFSIIHRKAHYYCSHKNASIFIFLLSVYYRYRLFIYQRKFLFQIPYQVTFGKGLNIVHYGRIIVAPHVTIGDNCNLFTGVTIGSTVRGSKKGVPTIGNDVWIGPNAVLVGKITIGNNILIAGNSYVNFDVPDNSIVIGNPGKIIPKDNATEGYICQRV